MNFSRSKIWPGILKLQWNINPRWEINTTENTGVFLLILRVFQEHLRWLLLWNFESRNENILFSEKNKRGRGWRRLFGTKNIWRQSYHKSVHPPVQHFKNSNDEWYWSKPNLNVGSGGIPEVGRLVLSITFY